MIYVNLYPVIILPRWSLFALWFWCMTLRLWPQRPFFVAQTWDAHCGKKENMLTKILFFFRYSTTHDFQMLHQVLVKPIEKYISTYLGCIWNWTFFGICINVDWYMQEDRQPPLCGNYIFAKRKKMMQVNINELQPRRRRRVFTMCSMQYALNEG